MSDETVPASRTVDDVSNGERVVKVVIEGVEEYLGNAKAICEASERARKIVAQLNEELKEFAELRKQALL